MQFTIPKNLLKFIFLSIFSFAFLNGTFAHAEPQNMSELLKTLNGTYSTGDASSCSNAIPRAQMMSFTRFEQSGTVSELVAHPENYCHRGNFCDQVENTYRTKQEYTYVSPSEFWASSETGNCIIDINYTILEGGEILKESSSVTDGCAELVKKASGKRTLYRCEGPLQ